MIVTGEQLARLRALAVPPVKQTKIAQLLGVSRQLVSLMEKGERTISPDQERTLKEAFPQAYQAVTTGAVREDRAPYGLPTREIASFLVDFLADPSDPALRTQALELLKNLL